MSSKIMCLRNWRKRKKCEGVARKTGSERDVGVGKLYLLKRERERAVYEHFQDGY